jgi:hypothetical protein
MEKAIFRTLCLSFLLLSFTAFPQGENSFSGQVIYHDNYPMVGVTAHLNDSTGSVIATAITDNSGYYTFSNVASGNYIVTFTTDQPSGGVSLTDPFIIEQRLSNLITFTPIQDLAADVDGDGAVTEDDYNLILIAYMNEDNPFPVGPWVFEQRSVSLPIGAREGFTSRGGSSGDVNGSLVPDPKISSIFLTNPTINATSCPSEPIKFELTSAGNLEIAGMHLVIKIPQGLNVLSVESPIPTASISIINNEVRVTWLDETRQTFEISNGMPLLVITTKAKAPSREEISYSLKLSNESHFINSEGELISGVSLVLPTINLSVVDDMAVNVYPNPFKEYVNLNYQLPGDGNIIISLFDQAGRQVREISNGNASVGSNQTKIDGCELMPGIYHYSIMYEGSDQLINTGTIIKSK